jgi:hypothetical protein
LDSVIFLKVEREGKGAHMAGSPYENHHFMDVHLKDYFRFMEPVEPEVFLADDWCNTYRVLIIEVVYLAQKTIVQARKAGEESFLYIKIGNMGRPEFARAYPVHHLSQVKECWQDIGFRDEVNSFKTSYPEQRDFPVFISHSEKIYIGFVLSMPADAPLLL